MPPKTKHTDDLGFHPNEPPAKRQKTDTPNSQAVLENILQFVEKAALGPWSAVDPEAIRMGVESVNATYVSDELESLMKKKTCTVADIDDTIAKIDKYFELSKELYKEYINKYPKKEVHLQHTLDYITKAKTLLSQQYKAALLRKPPPSAYARDSEWPTFQNLPNAILCMRPVDKRGLPIWLLHTAFLKFLSLSKSPLPRSPEAIAAWRVAVELCEDMGNSFDNTEKERGVAFRKALQKFLPMFRVFDEAHIGGGDTYGKVNKRISDRESDRDFAIIELKNGKTGDPYMQAARSYDLSVEGADPETLSLGAPMFLLCLSGPDLQICGAFSDNRRVVEPLSDWLLMLPDIGRNGGRVENLARHLYALRTCLDALKNDNSSVAGQKPCPRIFPKITKSSVDPNFEGVQENELHFDRLREDLWSTPWQNLFFDVKIDGVKALAKIVCDHYGTDVHSALAVRGMAPKLYGTSRVENVLLIAMESLGDEWMTLFAYRQEFNTTMSQDTINKIILRIEEILKCLKELGMVHGDLRDSNIMLRKGEEEKAILIDYDWAGKAGLVQYPLGRGNSSEYPGTPGGDIGEEDDSELFNSWKLKFTTRWRPRAQWDSPDSH